MLCRPCRVVCVSAPEVCLDSLRTVVDVLEGVRKPRATRTIKEGRGLANEEGLDLPTGRVAKMAKKFICRMSFCPNFLR